MKNLYFPKNRVCVNFEKNLRDCVNCEKFLRECVNLESTGGPQYLVAFFTFWKWCGSWLIINGYTFTVFHSIEHEGWLLLIFSWLMNYIPLMLDVFGKASVLRKSSKWNSPINNMKLLVLLRYSLWIIMHYELVVWCRFFHATFFLLLWYSMLTNQIFFEITNSNRVRIEDDVVILY